MQSRSAVVIVPIVAIAVVGAATLLLSRHAAPAIAPAIVPTLAAPPAALTGGVAVAPAPSPPSVPKLRYEQPIGGQFLSGSAGLMPAASKNPPALFLLSSAELSSPRYDWQMPALATAMAQELSAVLAEGCNNGCGAQVELARARLQQFLDSDRRHDDLPRTTRSLSKDPSAPDQRSIAIRSTAGAVTIDVTCRCESRTVGMRMWNDVTTCDARVRDRGRSLLQYAPRVELAYDHESLESPLEAYRQAVTFPDGAALVIESGYNYAEDAAAIRDDLAHNTPRRKLDVRGSVVWSKQP